MKKIFKGSLILAILHSILFFNQRWGISILLYVIPLIFFIINTLYEQGKIKNKKPLVLSIPILLISMTYMIFNNQFFQVCNMIAIVVLLMIMIILSVLEEKKVLDIASQVVLLLTKPFGKIEQVIQMAVDQIGAKKDQIEIDNEKTKVLKKIILGIIILLPILAVILLLLSSADMIFAKELGGITNWLQVLSKGITVKEWIARIILIIILTIYGASFIYNILVDSEQTENEETQNTEKIHFDHIIVNTVLTGVNIIYTIFCYIQIVNLFMGYTSLSETEYAEYARQGFFQLMAVSFINLVIILTTTHNAKEGTKGQKNYTKGMNLLLAIFTFIILLSSFMRMQLYEQTYGYTFLRLMVYMVLITEVILMIPTIIHIFNKKINLIKPYFTIILVMYLVVNYINVDAVIAKKNIDRYFNQAGTLEQEIDFHYLKTTGIDGIFEIERLLETEDEQLKKEVNNYIYEQKNQNKNKNNHWQEYNINQNRLKKEFRYITYQY